MSRAIELKYYMSHSYVGTIKLSPKNIKFDPAAGLNIWDAAKACISLTGQYNLPLVMIFNDKKINVKPATMTKQEIVHKYFDVSKQKTKE